MKVENEGCTETVLVLYSLEGCPFCIEAKNVLKKLKVKHETVDVTHNNKEDVKKALGKTTFPQLVLKVPGSSGKGGVGRKGVEKGVENVMLGGFEDLERIVAVCKLLRKAKIDGRAVSYICRGGK